MNEKKKTLTKENDASDPICLFYYPRSEYKTKPRESYRPSTKEPEESQSLALARTQCATRRSVWKHRGPTPRQQQGPTSSDPDEGLSSKRHQPPRVQKCFERRVKERRFKRKSKPRRFGKEPIRNLTSYLFVPVKSPSASTQDALPSLTNVFNTITTAWQDNKQIGEENNEEPKIGNSDETNSYKFERRRSVPEEIIRKFTVSKDRTSESEANITMPEATSPSSKESEPKQPISGAAKLKSNVFSQKLNEQSFWKADKSFCLIDDSNILRSAEEGSSDSDSDALERFNTIKRAPLRRESVVDELREPKLNQSVYYEKGKGILKENPLEKSSQTNDCICYPHSNESRTTHSPWEESDSAESSETIFSSPRFCTRPLSSSDNLSSDSECIKCTCAEMISSKDTSTDLYHSGKSTLSQTVSDKSTSTQDSTASINSVSSRGSSISAATDSSTSDQDPRTSAKETTSTAENTPRTPKNDGRRNGSRGNGQNGHSRNCPLSRGNSRNLTKTKETNNKNQQTDSTNYQTMSSRVYEWAQYTEEEMKVFQDQKQKKFFESGFNTFSNVLNAENLKIAADVGSCYSEVEKDFGLPTMVPRYSALPRSMSMLVNSSSFDNNQQSDSDCPSLADSLEDGENRRDLCYYDTKQELKPVRGEVKAEKKRSAYKNEPKGRAYFFSVDDEGNAELVTSIHKIPELPKPIKNKIHNRHLSISRNNELKEIIMKDEKIKTEVKRNYNNRKLNSKRVTSKIKPSPKESAEKKCSRKNETSLSPVKVPSEIKKEVEKIKCETPEMDKKETREPKNLADASKNGIENLKLAEPIIKPTGENSYKESSKDDKEKNETRQNKSEPIINIQEGLNKELIKETKSKVSEQKTSVINELSKHRKELISSLESTATVLKNQQQNSRPIKSQLATKRIGRFQQRFEVIPEERSSSLTSSAEDPRSEKNRRRSLPVKLSENVKSPTLLTNETGNKSFRRYTLGSIPNGLIAQLMGRPLQAIPCVQHGPNNQSQQIIIFSPKDSVGRNSAKGRDALLAMNREDFNRLSKGWMNFYLLKESSESDNEDDDAKEDGKSGNENNTIVCHLPSMEKDPSTTSESYTDETITPPNLNNTFSLLQGKEGKSLQLQEITEKENGLFLISEEPENITTESKDENLEKESEVVNEENMTKTEVTVKKKDVSTCTEKFPKKKTLHPIQLTAPVKLTSSNTVLNILKEQSSSANVVPKSSRSCSLPELNTEVGIKCAPVKTQSLVETLPHVAIASGSDDSDSDSTVYMEAVTPRIPRLPLEDCYSSDESSTNSGNKNNGLPREKHIPLRRRPLPFRPKNRYSFHESVHGKKSGNPGWSVTVEGTLAFPRARPGVQMRLSFPGETGPPVVSQSDSGFVDDRETLSRSKQQKQQWTVTVKNPQNGDGGKEKQKGVHLPTLSKRSVGVAEVKRGAKENECYDIRKQIEIGRKLSKIWPRVQQVIESEIKNIAEELILGDADSPLLSVEGRAMSFEKKPKFQTNTQRDLTRSNTARSDLTKTQMRP